MANKDQDACVFKTFESVVTELQRKTKMFTKVTNASYAVKLQAALKAATPGLDKAYQALGKENCEQLYDFVDSAGFAPSATKGRSKQAAKWIVPDLADWAAVYEALSTMLEVVEELRVANDTNKESAQDVIDRKRKGRASPQPQNIQDILDDDDDDQNFDPNTQPKPGKVPKTNTIGITPTNLAKDQAVQLGLQQFANGDPSLLRNVGSSQAAENSKWDLPKPLTTESEVKFDAQGNLRQTKRKLHGREKWMELALRKMDELARDPEPEQHPYGTYVGMINNLCEHFSWDVLAEFDDTTRERIKRRELPGFDVSRLHTEFLIKHGQSLLTGSGHSGGSGGGSGGRAAGGNTSNGGRASGNGAKPQGKTCNFFNSKKGCSRDSCLFPHKCSKCGGAHSKINCDK